MGSKNQTAKACVVNGVGLIPLHRMNGEVRAWTVVDSDRLDELAAFNWCLLANKGYVVRNRSRKDGGGLEYMARKLLDLSQGDRRVVDHIDRDRLNNRRSNLRVITHEQNLQNASPQRGKSSQFRGVSWSKQSRKWQAGATCGDQRLSAYFDDELEAAAFAKAARQKLLPYAVD